MVHLLLQQVTQVNLFGPVDEEDAAEPVETIQSFMDPNWQAQNVAAIQATARMAQHHKALRQLTGKSEARMHLRLAILHTFREAGPFLEPADLDRELAWIRDDKRMPTIERLKAAGWLTRLDSGAYCMAREARQLTRVFWTFLGSISAPEDGTGLSPGTEAEDLAWALDHGADPTAPLENLRLELLTVATIIEDGLSSGSHRRLEGVKAEARNLIQDIGRTHTLLQQCRDQGRIGLRETQDMFGLLSRVFRLHAELESRLARESRNLISTRPGFTPQRIFGIFVNKPIDELVAIGERYMLTPHIPPLFINADRFKGEAARYLSSPRLERPEISWEDPVELAPTEIRKSPTVRMTPSLIRVVEDLRKLAQGTGGADAGAFLPTGEIGESLLRVAVVAMLSSDSKAAAEVAPDLVVGFSIDKDDEGQPRPPTQLQPGTAIAAMTPAKITARERA